MTMTMIDNIRPEPEPEPDSSRLPAKLSASLGVYDTFPEIN
jgi:hypothetical protein